MRRDGQNGDMRDAPCSGLFLVLECLLLAQLLHECNRYGLLALTGLGGRDGRGNAQVSAMADAMMSGMSGGQLRCSIAHSIASFAMVVQGGKLCLKD